MMYDVVVVGGGPGGYVSAIRAAQLGLSVAVVEKDQLGGTCLNRGCIPTKALAHTAEVLAGAQRGSDLGLVIPEARVDFPRVMARKDKVTMKLRAGIGLLFKRNRIDLYTGDGKVIEPGVVEVSPGLGKSAKLGASGGSSEVRRLEAKNVVLATGSVAVTPRVFGYDGVNVLTSEEALRLSELPARILIVGAGVIGCEFASIFRTFGCEVTLVDIMPNILPMVDDDVANAVRTSFARRGIKILTGTKVTDVTVAPGLVSAAIEGAEPLQAEKMLLSIGRRPFLGDTVAPEIGLSIGESGEVDVDSHMRTNVPGIWAIGDLTGKVQLAHVASAQGVVAAENMAGEPREMEYFAVPNCIFTSPEVAACGVSERGAKESGIEYKVGKFPYAACGKAMAMGETEGFVKIIADGGGRVIGGQVVGAHASDLIAEIALAVSRQMSLSDVAGTIHAHPTLAESVAEAALAADGIAINI